MAASQNHSGKKRLESRLVDTHTKQNHYLDEGGRLLIVSHAHLESLEDYDHVHKTLQLSPTVERDVYCVEVMVQGGKGMALVCVHRGTCYVNGEEMREGEKPHKMKNGTFLDLGASYQFQYLTSKVSSDSPVKRVLPQTPGQASNGKPPSKPPRQQVTKTKVETNASETSSSFSYSGSVDMERAAIDEGLRARLKRIAKEIASRVSGYQDRKPPPPYEQAGNSIGYQLLHQNNSEVTTELIDRLYPALKELELKDPGLTDKYSSYVTNYDESREAGATPQCMLPGDIPTINFITDVVVDLCCIPQMVSLSEKYAPLFARILAIFSSSPQNQSAMAAKRHTTKILSCMNLTIMSNVVEFQQHGWTLLANTLATPTSTSKKPLLSEASLTLALNLIEHQLSGHNLELELSLSIIKFLSVVAATAKRCTQAGSGRDEATPIYTPTQASGIIQLLNDTKILRHVMKVPQDIRSDPGFECHYSVVVKCLAPTRSKRKPMIRRGTTSDLLETPTPPSPTTPSPPISTPSISTASSVPPPKPKRLFRHRRSTVGAHSHNENTKKTTSKNSTHKEGQVNLSTSFTVPNGRVTTSKEQDADHVTTSSRKDHQAVGTDLNSTSEISTESDLYTLSCSALPNKTSTSESFEQDVPQSISAPELPQRDQERCEVNQEEPVHELVKPVLNQEIPVKSEELAVKQDQEPFRPAEVLKQDQEKPVKPEIKQNEAELAQKESDPSNDKEAPINHTIVEGEQKEEANAQSDKVNEGENDIITASDDVTAKDETAHSVDASTVVSEHSEGDASTAAREQAHSITEEKVESTCSDGEENTTKSEQGEDKHIETIDKAPDHQVEEIGSRVVPSSNEQAINTNTENNGGEKVAINDSGNDQLHSVGEERCSQAASQRDSPLDEGKLVDTSEHEGDLQGNLSQKGEEGDNVDAHKPTPASETPPTISDATPPAPGSPQATSESPLKAGASTTLGDNSPLHVEEHTPPLITSMDTELQTTAGNSPQLPSSSLDTERTSTSETTDHLKPHSDTPPNTDEFSSIDNSVIETEKSDSLAQLQDTSESALKEPPNIELISSPDNSVLVKRETLSPEIPWSPNTASLARDVQDLLTAVQAPLEEEQMVRVPSISRNSRYYRVSIKGSTPKSSRRGQEDGSTPKSHRHGQAWNLGQGDSPSDRQHWGCATPPSAVRGHAEASPFEVSGEFLSTTHQAIEDIVSGHQDMKDALQGRLEIASGVVGLWRRDKGLQASTNLVQACFSSGKDLVLFIDILQQLLKHQAPWTLAVCFVILPVLRQLLTTQTDERCVCVVCDALLMIINRFSDLILFSKGKSRAHQSRRLSSTVDREQREVCYNELHSIRKNLHSRLDQNYDMVAIGNHLRKLHAALKQYKEPLDEH